MSGLEMLSLRLRVAEDLREEAAAVRAAFPNYHRDHIPVAALERMEDCQARAVAILRDVDAELARRCAERRSCKVERSE